MLRRLFAAITLALLLLFVPAVAHADANNFTVKDFTADYYLSKDDPQGKLKINEQITVNFNDNNHGLLRAISKKYNGQDQHLQIVKVLRDGQTEPYTTYNSNGNEVLKIGNANQTVTGEHVYTLVYTAQNVIRFTTSSDVLNWNTNGTQWQQPFTKVTARLHFSGINRSAFQGASCATGAYGSTEQACTVDVQGDTAVIQTTRVLNAGENMTFTSRFSAGTFTKPTAADWWRDHAVMIIQLLAPPLIALTLVYPYWRKHGKDIKGRGTVVPEYQPPKDLRAAEADTIVGYRLSSKGISATVIDLAIRKYIKIIEGESKGVLGLGKHKEYTLQRLVPPAADTLKPYESDILNGLFPDGDTTKLDDLKNKFYVTSQKVQGGMIDNLTSAGYFPANPKKAVAKLLVPAAVVVFGSFFLFSVDWALAAGMIIAGLIVAGFGLLMPRRTAAGVEAKDTLAGLKLYMNTAEKDRIAMLQSPNRPYAEQSDAPQQTVELFEKLLPFAMVLGVETQWAKQFENIYTTPPDWYSGNWSAFNTGLLVGSLNNSMSAMNTSFAAPGSSGSGSGGGFSGGGGGGGGGGGW